MALAMALAMGVDMRDEFEKDYLIPDEYMTPKELCDVLQHDAFFTPDQAYYISSEVYQPLMELIIEMKESIDFIKEAGD